ncbi:hypothetical protein BH09MYX1_BH09MYX1_09520 [soil metagenome]
MRVIALLCVVAVTLACGSSMPIPQTPADDAGSDSAVDALDPFPNDLCEAHDVAITGKVLECSTGPCAGRSLVAGEPCSDLPLDAFCELGDHPDPTCNALFKCDAQHMWVRVQPARSTGACARTVKAGLGCKPDVCTMFADVPCLHPGPPVAACRSWHGECVAVGIDRLRLGCACSGPTPSCGVGCYGGVVKFESCYHPPG